MNDELRELIKEVYDMRGEFYLKQNQLFLDIEEDKLSQEISNKIRKYKFEIKNWLNPDVIKSKSLNSSSVKKMLICFPGIEGDFYAFRKLAALVNDKIHVRVFPYPLIQNSSIEQIVDYYLDEIQSFAGFSISIIGYSYGASLAFETARRLTQYSFLIKNLFILDGFSPEIIRKNTKNLDGIPNDEIIKEVYNTLDNNQIDFFQKENSLSGPNEMIINYTQIFRKFNSDILKYYPTILDSNCPFFLIKAKKTTEDLKKSSLSICDYGWGGLYTNNIIPVVLEGSHYSILKEPYVIKLSNFLLNKIINE